MQTIETTIVIDPSGQVILQWQVPPDLVPGEYRAVVVLEALPVTSEVKKKRPPLDFPVRDWGPWPENLSLRREDMYGDDER